MTQMIIAIIFPAVLMLILGLSGIGCKVKNGKFHAQGENSPSKIFPKDYIHPLTEINFEKVGDENRGLKVLEENVTTVDDCYRGGVQEKEEGERLLKEEMWEKARVHFEKSNKFLGIVLKYIPEDEAYRNIHGEEVIIFLPNLLMADNHLKLVKIYKEMKLPDKISGAKQKGEDYLSRSLRSVKTEWAYEIKKRFEQELP